MKKSISRLGLLILASALTCSASELTPNTWTKVTEDHKGHSAGAVWVKAPDIGKWLKE